MSYDYLLLKFKHPITSHKEITDDVVDVIDSNVNIRKQLGELFPSLVWDSSGAWGRIPDHSKGRFDFSLDDGEFTRTLKVLTSYSSDCNETVNRIAAVLGTHVFDLQTCELIDPNVDD